MQLTVIDDVGLLAISADAAEGLRRLVDAAYEKRTLVLSSNLRASGFDQLMDKTIASALVDRLRHTPTSWSPPANPCASKTPSPA